MTKKIKTMLRRLIALKKKMITSVKFSLAEASITRLPESAAVPSRTRKTYSILVASLVSTESPETM